MTQSALITGAASGLGRALVQEYLQAGWHVIMADRDESGLQAVSEDLSDTWRARTTIVSVDLTTESMTDAFSSVLDDLPRLDLLINNAGITHRSQASVTDPQVFDRVMAVNWRAPVRLTQHCLPWLEKASGQVICISSMAALMPVPGRAAYCASKAALAQHFETWRPELERRGIHLLMVYPSFLQTPIESRALGSDGTPTPRPRSVVGSIRSAESTAADIFRAHQRRRQRLLGPQWSPRLGAWLWHRAPTLYHFLTRRQFAEELQ